MTSKLPQNPERTSALNIDSAVSLASAILHLLSAPFYEAFQFFYFDKGAATELDGWQPALFYESANGPVTDSETCSGFTHTSTRTI